MDRRKPADVLFWALQCAIRDRETFAECYNFKGPEAKEAQADIKAFRNLSRKLLGTDRSSIDSMLENTPSASLQEIRKRMEGSLEAHPSGSKVYVPKLPQPEDM